jgi:hypothetical protein
MSCSNVQIEYDGNGSRVDYTFPFTYEDELEVHVGAWDETQLRFVDVGRDTWSFQNATTIRFTDAPDGKFIIYRQTDLEEMEVTFYPGSSIRAQDLNANFEQLRDAIQEGWCRVSEEFYEYLDEYIWDVRDTIYIDDQINGRWQNIDAKIATAGAIGARTDVYMQDPKPAQPPKEQPGKRWYDTTQLQNYIWDANVGAWIDYSRMGATGPRGRDGHHIVIMGTEPPTKRPDGDPICSGDIWLNTCTFDAFIYYCDPSEDLSDKDCNDCGECVDVSGEKPTKANCRWVTLGSSGPRGESGKDGKDGAQIWVNDKPPAKPDDYEFWFDTTCGDLFANYDGYWVQLNRPGKDGKDGNTKTIVSTDPPKLREDGSPLQNGDIWYDSCSGSAFLWYIEDDGKGNAKWVELAAGGVKGEAGKDGLDGHRVWCGENPPVAKERYPLWFNTKCEDFGLYFWCDGKWISTMIPGPAGPKGDDGGIKNLGNEAPIEFDKDNSIISFSLTNLSELP